MIIAFLKENDEHECRSMLLPEHIAPIAKLGFKVLVENGYAEKLNIDDKFYNEFGAELRSASDICSKSDIIIKISGKDLETFNFKPGSIIVTAFFDKSNDEILKLKNDKNNPVKDIKYFCKYLDITEKKFYQIAEKFRNKKINKQKNAKN